MASIEHEVLKMRKSLVSINKKIIIIYFNLFLLKEKGSEIVETNFSRVRFGSAARYRGEGGGSQFGFFPGYLKK